MKGCLKRLAAARKRGRNPADGINRGTYGKAWRRVTQAPTAPNPPSTF